MISSDLCVKCKGKLMCGLSRCPLYDKIREHRDVGRDVSGPSPPNYLISWKGYPRVSVGPSLSLGGLPDKAYEMGIEDFVSIRANELRTYQKRGIQTSEELALSTDPLQFDVKLKHKPANRPNPHGLSGFAEKVETSDTPKVPGKVYSLVDSYDTKAKDALLELEDYGFEYMVQVLSTGNLGVRSQRKMVPTRWAITAVDSTLAREKFKKVRGKRQINDFEVYRAEHWDNHFLIILSPWGWGFEMLESWHGKDIIQDYEYGRLKKSYAKNITGAYYAARLEVLRHLEARGRVAAAIVLRQIGEKYVYPVGVWHIREAVKRALEGNPTRFSSLKELDSEVGLGKDWKEKSFLWSMMTRQRRLDHFM